MFDYNTAEETAKKWDRTARYVQHLCKNGKIENAVKKGGVWFIPQNAQNPEEMKKAMGVFESAAKNIFFDKAIELFATYRFDSVTLKDITNAVGRNPSSIYNHFSSKQDILDNIYNYFCRYFLLDRPSIEELEPILLNGSLYDIINTVFYVFKSDHINRLILITKIIHTRQFTDERAKQIASDIMVQSGIEFAKSVFDRAVEVGRLAPFDTYSLSLFCNYVRQGTYNRVILDPSKRNQKRNQDKLTSEETVLKNFATSFLTDLHKG